MKSDDRALSRLMKSRRELEFEVLVLEGERIVGRQGPLEADEVLSKDPRSQGPLKADEVGRQGSLKANDAGAARIDLLRECIARLG